MQKLPKWRIYFSRALYISFFLLSFFGMMSTSVGATTLISQTDDSISSAQAGSFNGYILSADLGTISSSVAVNSLQIRAKWIETGSGNAEVRLFQCDPVANPTDCNISNIRDSSANDGNFRIGTWRFSTTARSYDHIFTATDFVGTTGQFLNPSLETFVVFIAAGSAPGEGWRGSTTQYFPTYQNQTGTSCAGGGCVNGIKSPFIEIYDSGGAGPTDTSTRVITIEPLQDAIASSSPNILGTFYNQNPLYNQLLLNLSWVEPSVNSDLLLSGLAHRQFIFDIGTSTSDQTFSTTTADLLTGRWLMTAQFSNGLSGSDYFTATTTSFIVGTTTTLFSQFFETYTASTSTTTPGSVISDCASAGNVVEKALCSLGDRIKDVLQYLFIPDSSVATKFSALKEEIFRRVPFGYFPLVKTALQDVSASSTPIYNFVMPLARQSLFNSIRSTLGAALYFWWLIHMWHRFKSIQL